MPYSACCIQKVTVGLLGNTKISVFEAEAEAINGWQERQIYLAVFFVAFCTQEMFNIDPGIRFYKDKLLLLGMLR